MPKPSAYISTPGWRPPPSGKATNASAWPSAVGICNVLLGMGSPVVVEVELVVNTTEAEPARRHEILDPRKGRRRPVRRSGEHRVANPCVARCRPGGHDRTT
ncbi:hypothetical protein SGPA1_21804 [Streptomyces misionensis JCM 4497]